MSKYIDLRELLPAQDKEDMEYYILTYAFEENLPLFKQHFVGIDKWLEQWSHSKQRLYKFLGNQFIKKIPFECNKDKKTLNTEISNLVNWHPFSRFEYTNFYYQYICTEGTKDENNYSESVFNFFRQFLNLDNILCRDGDLAYGIKFKFPNKNKTLQIPKTIQPMRALVKIVEYFKDDFEFKDFEDFRIKHSMILNDKSIKGELCISIHPFDFITMSDNASNWQSCMNWMNQGCYHTGTIECMNANNVVCCYLEAKNRFEFAEDAYWNSKRWRILAYVNKDIICMGKAYPYAHEDMNSFFLRELKKLAEENLGWTYDFGPEPYRDMKYFNTEYPFNRMRDYKKFHNVTKHSIIFDTKGMYNDFVSDHGRVRMCYRNKVKESKIISISGRSNCLCCNEDIVIRDPYWDGCDYNDRYLNNNTGFCRECKLKYGL